MATTCDNIDLIQPSESIGSSLIKINNNFNTLRTTACNIEKELTRTVNTRTFFYYGPNSATNSSSGVDDNVTSYPSKNSIQNFVNIELSLPTISESEDIVYVIYQKTGWVNEKIITQRDGKGTAKYTRVIQVPQYRKIGISRWVLTGYVNTTVDYYNSYNWSRSIEDQYINYAPIYIIYKLTFKDGTYTVDQGFPKFSRATTASSEQWNNPKAWTIYN